MSERKRNNDINLFRGNVDNHDIKVKELETTDTLSQFNFKKKKDHLNHNQIEIDRLQKLEQQLKEDQIEQARYKREQLEYEQSLIKSNQNKDPNIKSGARKPLRPYNPNVDDNVSSKGAIKPKRKKRKFKFIRYILLLLLILLIGLLISLFVIKSTAKPLNFTVIGVDQRTGQTEEQIRADAIMNVSASTKDNKIIMASIPRDTYAYLPCEETNDKITHAYVYGAINWADKGGGVACTTQSVANLLNINSDKYVKINFDDMVGIINAIGGVDLKSTGTFKEQDSKGKKNVYSFVKNKTYHMDGEMALAYSRHRKSDDDIQRGLRQQAVFKAMFVKVKSANIFQWPGIYTKVTAMIDTNLSQKDMLQVALIYASKGDMSTHKFEWSGVYYNGVSYVQLSKTDIKAYTNKVNNLN